ncbi:YdcF family protein [Metabacillus sp. FJAT-52054]|uniref:YdcF family protein n=1 Tax=Metabacillus sediminis TaxID=3117746 RepID=A0ABZ2NGM1_9BACI
MIIKKRIKGFIYFLLFTLIVIFLLINSRPHLIVDERPVKADAIVILSGSVVRLDKGIELFQKGYGQYLILSTPWGLGLTDKTVHTLPIPEKQLLLEKNATSTYTNALYTKELLEEYNLKSVLVVSSDYHMRRSKLTFDRVFRNSEIHLTYVAADKNSDPYWFLDSNARKIVISEYVKLIGYYFELYKKYDLGE